MSSYRIQEALLKQSERSLYHALSLIIAQRALILTKVKLSAILVPSAALGRQIAATQLDRYTVDFVLCDRQTTRPLLVIQQEKVMQQEGRDANGSTSDGVNELIERLANSCGLPIIRLPNQSAYRMDQMLRLIEPYLADDKRGSDYGASDRVASDRVASDRVAVTANNANANTTPIPRPATLFSTN